MMRDGVEMIVVHVLGGPLDGTRGFLPLTKLGGTWPPPEEIVHPTAPGGKYVRTEMSSIDDPVDHPNLARGVEYTWVPDSP